MCNDIINFHDGKYGLKYERYYLSKYHDQTAIVIVFKFANNSGETLKGYYCGISKFMEIEAFQHGVSLEKPGIDVNDDLHDKNHKAVQSGYTIEFGAAYILDDLSDVSIEVFYDENNIRKQTIKISDQEIEDTNTDISDFIPVEPATPAIVDDYNDDNSGTYHITSEEEFWDLVERYDLQEDYEGQFEELIEAARIDSHDYDADILQIDMELEDAIWFHGGNPFNPEDNRQAFFGDFDFNDEEDE